MWIVVWLSMLNAMASGIGFINVLRVNIAGAPMGILEVSVATAFLIAVFYGGTIHSRYPRLRAHPALLWSIGLWVLAWLGGVIGALRSYAPAYDIMIYMRDYALFPIAIYIGYRLLGTPRSVKAMAYWIIAAGIGNAVMLFLRFGSGASRMVSTDNLNKLREIEYATSYACGASLILIFGVLAGFRILRPWLATLLGLFCFLGALATLHRTVMVVLASGLMSLLFILPKGKRVSGVVRIVVIVPLLIGTIALGLELASKATGQNFHAKMADWTKTLLPGETDSKEKGKAWDSRTDSIKAEMEAFAGNPLTGAGFAWHQDYIYHGNTNWGAFNHNAWTSVMANTGIFGLAAMLVMTGVMALIGRRMIFEAVDGSSMLFGVVAYSAGVMFAMYGVCTMVFQARGALHFALLCGMVIRAREIQEATRHVVEEYPDMPPELAAEGAPGMMLATDGPF